MHEEVDFNIDEACNFLLTLGTPKYNVAAKNCRHSNPLLCASALFIMKDYFSHSIRYSPTYDEAIHECERRLQPANQLWSNYGELQLCKLYLNLYNKYSSYLLLDQCKLSEEDQNFESDRRRHAHVQEAEI